MPSNERAGQISSHLQQIPTQQHALQVHEVGKPLQLTTIPVPEPGANQVLVQVKVASLNPHDQKSRDLGLFLTDLPVTIGNDVVGNIVSLGTDVSAYSFIIGDRIVGQASWENRGSQMALQEYAVLDIDHIAHIPDEISDDEAATLPTNIMAPFIALFDKTKLGLSPPWSSGSQNAEQTLLIIGGGSNCGKFATQLARLAGIGKIIVVGGDGDELTRYGATKVLDRHGSTKEVLARIRDEVGDDLVYAFDAVNPPGKQSLVINSLSRTKKGKFARLLRRGDFDVENIVEKESGFEAIDILGVTHAFPELGREFWKRLPEWLRDGKVKAPGFVKYEGLDAEKVNEVLDGYRDRRRVVKSLFHIS